MNKTVKTVFLLIGLIVLIFLIWQLVFNNGGIVKTIYNAMARGINKQFVRVAGTGQTLLPYWDMTKAQDNGQGFDINTNGN